MTTAYPGAIDDFTNPTASDTLNSNTVPHASQHADVNDAIEAIETALGANPAGSALDLNISQVTAAAADEVAAVDVDTEGVATYFKFTVDGTEYAVPAYAIVPA